MHIFNLSLETGLFPDKLKIAKIIPIYKKDDPTLPCNYRPISLLSIFSKIFEKIMSKRLLNFWNRNNILYEFQFGFRANHSTTYALIEIMDNIYGWLEEGYYVAGIYFDLSKAFDTVDHSILLHKLYYNGVRGTAFNWFKDYLSNRKQYTCVGNVNSSLSDIVCGVPQGSVLGPLLFLLYINDIANASSITKPRIFADDTNLFVRDKNFMQLNTSCNTEIEKINCWMIANKLSVNIDKTCYSIFSPKRNHSCPMKLTLKIGNNMLKESNSNKYLGVIIDDKLNWKDQIKNIRSNLLKYVGIFYKIRQKLPTHCLRDLYFALVYPNLIYGIEIYANTCKSFLDEIIIINNKILRILQRKPISSNVYDLYYDYNTVPLNMLFTLKLLLFMHKYIHHRHLLPTALHEMCHLNSSVHNYNTRNKGGLHIVLHSTSIGQRSLKYQCSKLWNNLPDALKNIQSINVFKKTLLYTSSLVCEDCILPVKVI